MENKTLMTDFYELTMAQTYFNEGKKDEEGEMDDADLSGAPDIGGFPGDGGGDDYDDED